MANDTIQVVVCTYQGESFIQEQLDSIATQTYVNINVHIFDDGSTDNTLSIIKQHCKKYPHFFYYRNTKNLGFLRNFETAMKHVTGDYIALSDQDDIWLPDKLEQCMGEMKQLERQFPQKPVLVHSDLELIDSSGKGLSSSFFLQKKINLTDGRSLNQIMGHCGVMGNTILMNSLLIKAALPFPLGLKYHDYWLALVNEFLGVRKTINKPLVKYRMHDNNVSNNTIAQVKPAIYSQWLKRDFALPFLEDDRAKIIGYFLQHYRFSAEDRDILERYYQYLLFAGNRLSHYHFLIRNDFLKADLGYRCSVFFRMMLTSRYTNKLSMQKRERVIMNKVELNQAVADFSVAGTSDTIFNLSDHKGKSNVVIYFYPKDSTPGCTLEGKNFRDLYAEFQGLDTQIVGVSRDSMKRHENFKAKQKFPFELLADESGEVCDLFGVWQQKQLFGKKYMGIVRSTFIIDKQGVLRKQWLNLSVKGHVDEVLQVVKDL
jgi:peroxiredoxin Q/BCP